MVADSAVQHRATLGNLVRLARQRSRMSQSELGLAVGFSGSVISRIESGKRHADQPTLIAIADATHTAPEHFGVLRPAKPSDISAVASLPGPHRVATLINEPTKGDVVQRREFVLSAMALAGAVGERATGPLADPAHPTDANHAVADLDRALFHPGDQHPPVSATQLDRALAAAQTDFRAARYGALGAKLPRLIEATQTSRTAAEGAARQSADARVADTLSLASDWCSKQNQDALAWVTADRAFKAAQHSGHATALGEAARTMAIAMRRSGHHTPAVDLLEKSATGLDVAYGNPSSEALGVYGTLMLTAAYSAAQHGDRSRASELLAEAEHTATRLTDARKNAAGLF
ncbi:MAG: helix-turn-helix domain-containing protein, partial [Sciscionella sp.]